MYAHTHTCTSSLFQLDLSLTNDFQCQKYRRDFHHRELTSLKGNWKMELCVKTKWYKNVKALSHLSLLPLLFSVSVCSPFHSSAPHYPPKLDLSPVLLPPVLSLAFRLTSHVSFHVPIKPGQVAIALPLTHITFSHCPQLKRFSSYAGCLRWFVLDGNFSGW